VSDPNIESLNGYIVEKKMGNGSYTELEKYENVTSKSFTDTIDYDASPKIRYRVRTIFMDGTLSGYSNEVGFDMTVGDDYQFGNLSFSNIGWNPVLFHKPFASVNNVITILGSLTNNNNSVLLTGRANLLSTGRFNAQVIPWTYQNRTTISSEELGPYLILNVGNYNFGELKAIASRATIASTWTPVTFSTPFDTVPVVFVSQLVPQTVNATVVRVRNVTKTGFEAQLQKEATISKKLNPEIICFFAITPGIGDIDNHKLIVGRTENNSISTSASTQINYGDSIPDPIFISQMQTCNDVDAVTAVMRCLTITDKYSKVFKQRERSLGIINAEPESAGWMVINPAKLNPQALNTPLEKKMSFYPNPVKDFIYLNRNTSENLNVEIYNMLGILVEKNISIGNEITVSNLLPGYYVLSILNHKPQKFIKL